MMTFAAAFTAAAAGCLVWAFRGARPILSREIVTRVAVPPLVALVLHGLLALATGFDLVAAFRESHEFHSAYYPFAGATDWLYAAVGGQLELAWGVGPAVWGIAVAALARSRFSDPSPRFALAVLAAYAVALAVGPNPLKLETARCWFWIATVPALLAADRILGEADARGVAAVAGSSILVGVASVAFLDFGV
jgi:hypothetical protein